MARRVKQYPVGTTFEKEYKGEKVKVVATKNGYRYAGKVYDSLQEAVSKITKGKKYPASVFFGIKSTRKAKSNGTELDQGSEVGAALDLNTLIQNEIRDQVREKVAELFRS